MVKDRVVLDVGSGCGAGAIAAAMGHARTAVANDIDPGIQRLDQYNYYMSEIKFYKICIIYS